MLFPGRVLPRGLWDPHQVWGGGNVPETTFPASPKAQENLRESMKPSCFFFFFFCDTFIPGIEGNSFLQKEIHNPF